MVKNTSGICHTAGRNNYLRTVHIVDSTRLFRCSSKVQVFHIHQATTLHHVQSLSLFVILSRISHGNMGCLICHGAIHVNRNLRNFTFTQQFLEVVQQNLCTPHCEGRDNNIATTFCSFINDTRQLALFVINFMSSVAVGRFCNHKIRAGQISRVFDNGLVRLSNVTSEDELGLLTIFFHTHFYDSRAQNMTCHLELNGDSRNYAKPFVKIMNFKHGQGFVSIVQGKERLYQFFTGTHTLAISKFCVALLNVSTVR